MLFRTRKMFYLLLGCSVRIYEESVYPACFLGSDSEGHSPRNKLLTCEFNWQGTEVLEWNRSNTGPNTVHNGQWFGVQEPQSLSEGDTPVESALIHGNKPQLHQPGKKKIPEEIELGSRVEPTCPLTRQNPILACSFVPSWTIRPCHKHLLSTCITRPPLTFDSCPQGTHWSTAVRLCGHLSTLLSGTILGPLLLFPLSLTWTFGTCSV